MYIHGSEVDRIMHDPIISGVPTLVLMLRPCCLITGLGQQVHSLHDVLLADSESSLESSCLS